MLRRVSVIRKQAAPSSVELRKLLSLHFMLKKQEQKNISAASLIISTAFTPASDSAGMHHPDCSVWKREIPLTSISEDERFHSKPCTICLNRRLHFLASSDFCKNMEHISQKESSPPSKKLLTIVEGIYGSFDAFKGEIIDVAIKRGAPGMTWVVYNPECSHKNIITVMNLSSMSVPLQYGLWPLTAIDMSEEAIGRHIQIQLNDSVERKPPLWSRAARNPSSVFRGKIETGKKSLAHIRRQIVVDAIEKMNWSFVSQQLDEADLYYTSPNRTDLQQRYSAELERKAGVKAMRHLKDIGTTILSSDTVKISSASSKEPEAELGAGKPATTSEDQQQHSSEKTSDAGPQCNQLPDGTWEYSYPNGDLTLLRPDGTKVFHTSNLVTTVYVDGSTLYEFSNKTSIFDRADGIRVTTHADGQKTEEPIKK